MQIKNQVVFLRAKQDDATAAGDPQLAQYYGQRVRDLRSELGNEARRQERLQMVRGGDHATIGAAGR